MRECFAWKLSPINLKCLSPNSVISVPSLVAKYGWVKLSQLIKINCFRNEPSVKSSLKFLRRTPWARSEVEALYLNLVEENLDDTINYSESDPWANSRYKK